MTSSVIIAEYTIKNNREFLQYKNRPVYPFYNSSGSWKTGNTHWFDLSQFVDNLEKQANNNLISHFKPMVNGWKSLKDFVEKNRAKMDIDKLTKIRKPREILYHLFTEKGYRVDAYYRTTLEPFLDYDIQKRTSFKKYYNQIMLNFLLIIQRLNSERLKKGKNVLIHYANKSVKKYIGQFFAPTWSYHFNRWVDLIKDCPSRRYVKHLYKNGNLLGVY